jgi:hypothetical protein
MEPEPIEYAVDQMAKDLDWLMKVGLKAKKIDIDSITEPQMADLKSRFLSQLPQINGDPPGSPLQTTVSGGSHKSDDEMSAFSDDPRQMGDRTEIPLVSGLAEDVVGIICCHTRTIL